MFFVTIFTNKNAIHQAMTVSDPPLGAHKKFPFFRIKQLYFGKKYDIIRLNGIQNSSKLFFLQSRIPSFFIFPISAESPLRSTSK